MSQERPMPINPGEDGSDQAPSEDTTKRPEPTPSASIHNFSDPDTLSSDSTGSLREQLHLVNQRIDDAYRTLRTKDEHAEGPLRDSPFVQEIQNVPIPSQFHLSMLEAYDDSFDPTKHMKAFYVQMILYDTLDVIIADGALLRSVMGVFDSSMIIFVADSIDGVEVLHADGHRRAIPVIVAVGRHVLDLGHHCLLLAHRIDTYCWNWRKRRRRRETKDRSHLYDSNLVRQSLYHKIVIRETIEMDKKKECNVGEVTGWVREEPEDDGAEDEDERDDMDHVLGHLGSARLLLGGVGLGIVGGEAVMVVVVIVVVVRATALVDYGSAHGLRRRVHGELLRHPCCARRTMHGLDSSLSLSLFSPCLILSLY
ncbi:hypothetical protein B296_00016362 [Ensete ventricosum]|uniref:Uncharacterized protein n=1 Tax=Ensete ventricosum TaxID=4639 RepID=A0A426YUH7_ENSVE|nr:hypothetical protein B296_00016362 [Ensete ventricosum]